MYSITELEITEIITREITAQVKTITGIIITPFISLIVIGQQINIT